jgi:hypothetical protein
LLTVLCASTSACVSSVQPYVTEQSARFAPELIGTWTDTAATERAVITRAGPRAYTVVYTENGGDTKRFLGRLGRVGTHHLLDLQIAQSEKSSDDSSGTHLAVVLDTVGPRIAVAVLEPDTLKRYLQLNPGAVAHRLTKDEVIFTASSADLAKFLATYLKRPGVLGDRALWVRQSP